MLGHQAVGGLDGGEWRGGRLKQMHHRYQVSQGKPLKGQVQGADARREQQNASLRHRISVSGRGSGTETGFQTGKTGSLGKRMEDILGNVICLTGEGGVDIKGQSRRLSGIQKVKFSLWTLV